MSLVLLGILNSQVSGAAAGAYDLLETQELTSSASSVTFTGLDSYSDYKHLQVRFTSRNDGAGSNIPIRLNGDSGSNYAVHWIWQSGGSGPYGYASTSATYMSMLWSASSSGATNSFGTGYIDILDFASTNKATTLRAHSGFIETFGRQYVSSGLWTNTSAVTSLELLTTSGNLVANSRFSIYGVR